MNLGEFRALLVQRSGRYDLVNLDNSDNGANAFINAAQRNLDRRTGYQDDSGRFFKKLAIGEFFISLPNSRTIESVWASTSLESWELGKADISYVKEYYAAPFLNVTPGSSKSFSLVDLRSIPDLVTIDKFAKYATEILVDGSQRDQVGLVILPPVDEEIQIEVCGKFYSALLSLDEDTSYWTVNHPDTLLKAVMLELEVVNRNSEGVKDWLNALEIDTVQIEFDAVETESNNVTRMEG